MATKQTRDQARLICLVLALVTLVVYLPVRHHGFVRYDDPKYVSENWHVQSGVTMAGLRWAFTTGYFSNWHPLTWVSYMADFSLFGLNPSAQHVINVLFHIANSVLLFLLLARWTKAPWPSALVAALFAWHPLHVESVAWISARKDVLSMLFALLALLSYGNYARLNKRRHFWLAGFFLALGLMAKPMLVTLPCLMVLLDFWPLGRLEGSAAAAHSPAPADRRSLLALIVEKWPFFLLAAASSIVTCWAQSAEALVSLESFPVSLRLGNAIVSYPRYLSKMFWPADLSVIYPMPDRWPPALILLSLIVLSLISALAWRARRTCPYALMGWLWFLGTLVPVLGIVQVGGQAMADRYTYLPSVGLFIALAWSARGWLAANRTRWSLPALVLALCLAGTYRQLQHWRNSETLFRHAIAVTPANAIARANLGLALEQEGHYEEALLHLREALRIAPNLAQAHNNLGNVLSAMGQSEEAIAAYRVALNLKPNASLTHLNLGLELSRSGRYEEAMQHYIQAAQISPGDPLPHDLMGSTRLREGQITEAMQDFRAALRLDPNNPKALVHLARLLATSPDPRWRDGEEAVRLAKRANDLTGEQAPYILDTLGMAHAEAGAFALAIQAAQRAGQLAASLGDTQAVAIIHAHIEGYKNAQPYREPIADQPKAGLQR